MDGRQNKRNKPTTQYPDDLKLLAVTSEQQQKEHRAGFPICQIKENLFSSTIYNPSLE